MRSKFYCNEKMAHNNIYGRELIKHFREFCAYIIRYGVVGIDRVIM